ncbi:MAG: hypothetical protein Q8L47_01845 [bacterium]|nr:hypothetical protein [bacterium]
MNLRDADLVSRYTVGFPLTADQKKRADVINIGVIDMSDAIRIAQYGIGLYSTLPVCGM